MKKNVALALASCAVLVGCGQPWHVAMEPGDQVRITVREEHSMRTVSCITLQADDKGRLIPVGPGQQ